MLRGTMHHTTTQLSLIKTLILPTSSARRLLHRFQNFAKGSTWGHAVEQAWAEFARVVVRARGGKSFKIYSCLTFEERIYNGETHEILNRVLAAPYL